MCPLFASDEELARLPTTFICTGGCDPLLDDMVEFDTRLRRQNVPGELRVRSLLFVLRTQPAAVDLNGNCVCVHV